MSSGQFAPQNGAGDSFVNGPSQNAVYPLNPGFMAPPPQPGYISSVPAKGLPAGPQSCYNTHRHQPSPVGTPSPLPASPNHRPVLPGPPQASPTPPPHANSHYQHTQQPSSWSSTAAVFQSTAAPPALNVMAPHQTFGPPPAAMRGTPPLTVPPPTVAPPPFAAVPPPSTVVPPPRAGVPPPSAVAPPPFAAIPPTSTVVPPPRAGVPPTSAVAPPPFAAVPPPPAGAHSDGPYHPGQMNRPVGSGYPSLQPGYSTAQVHTPPVGQIHPPGQIQHSSMGQIHPTAQIPPPSAGQFHPAGQMPPSAQQTGLSPSLAALSLQSHTPEALRVLNLLQERSLLPHTPVTPPLPCLPQDLQKMNCSPEVFRCTLTSIPQTQALLNKAKLPLGLLLHPFKDLSQLPVVTSSNIVRCRSCRTYINPFVTFMGPTKWKCNLCHRVNEVPEEFMYNPVSKSYGAPHKRPEVQNATIEFIAPSEYMLRPPQPAVYLFVLDVSHNAVETGYLDAVCRSLLDNLSSLPGDARTKIGFITFDSTIHFYSLQEGLSRPQMLIVSDIDDVFLPTQDGLLVNLNECKELVQDLLSSLPQMWRQTMETHSALGPALQAAFKLLSATGGRVSLFQTQLPTLGIGALRPREQPSTKTQAKDVQHLSPATDFYKKLALDCSGQHVAVDLFLLSAQYCDLSSLGCISRYSAGSVFYYPSYHTLHNPAQTERFQKDLKRYLTRKIGFEAVMRIRCTKGLSIHTFHGNFFVRSTDLLSLANVNPDAGFALQMNIEENLLDLQTVSFQAALLYTSSKGERRIRVHTLCLPVVNSLSDIFAGADVQAITALLASMAVDRSVTASVSDARDALVNAAVDMLSSYRSSVLTVPQPGLLAPACLRLFPLYILALLKHKAFGTSSSTRLDERMFCMCQLKQQPLAYAMLSIHPSLYRVDDLTDEGALNVNDCTIPQPRVQQLSVEKLSRDAAFLMDCGSVLYLWIGRNCNPAFLTQVLGVDGYAHLPPSMTQLPELDTAESCRMRAFVDWLRERRPFHPLLHVIRDESPLKAEFLQLMIEDRSESALSYYEFLLHLQQQSSK
ncbi:protein transport protein Sec24A isoform X2 [Danio aesculapii]|uniref:protein transport protein Sec24A isoform X2 n=1 Tax=Danio aesculapii TaxID=1142201 RepID=UPI0024C039B4|nr:protein transport protein Sec24A isoform X2 [Danio aesculapii]